MIACIVIPGFLLRAALRLRPSLAPEPAAPAREATEPLVGLVTAAAEAAACVRECGWGRRSRSARRSSSSSPIRRRRNGSGESVLRRSRTSAWRSPEASPASSTSRPEVSSGSTAASRPRSRRRFLGGRLGVDARAGAAGRRFAALAVANVARPGQILVVSDEQARDFLAPLPLDLPSLDESRQQELRSWACEGLESLPGFRAAPLPNAWGRTAGAPESLARGGDQAGASAPPSARRARRVARVPGGDRERAHAAARVRGATRAAARLSRSATTGLYAKAAARVGRRIVAAKR